MDDERPTVTLSPPSGAPEARLEGAPSRSLEAPSALPSATLVANAIRHGLGPTDAAFDRFLPRKLRLVSRLYWTPLPVILRIATWLRELGIETVVDIGSGAGKFCVAAALATRARFIGLEQRGHLVEAARDLALQLGVEGRVRFVEGAFADAPLPDAEAYYLFNPFGENLLDPRDRLDDSVELGDARYLQDISAVRQLLRAARVGTYVVTYNGFGGRVPGNYQEVRVDRELPNVLRMWRKTARTDLG